MQHAISTTRSGFADETDRVQVSEYRIFAAATALVAVHIVDDEFVQRQPGTSVVGHLPAGLVPVGVALLATLTYRRLRPGPPGTTAAAAPRPAGGSGSTVSRP